MPVILGIVGFVAIAAAAAIYLLIQKKSHSFSLPVDQLKIKAKKENNDLSRGRILEYRYAEPGATISSNFIKRAGSNRHMTMGIMFHGTHGDNIGPICRNGIYKHSCFTSSMHYAVRRVSTKRTTNERRSKCQIKMPDAIILSGVIGRLPPVASGPFKVRETVMDLSDCPQTRQPPSSGRQQSRPSADRRESSSQLN
eukprot:gene18960-25534_t